MGRGAAWVVAGAVAALALAGCVGPASDSSDEAGGDGGSASGSGVARLVHGIVTDDSFSPVAGALVAALAGTANATTNETGGYELRLGAADGDLLSASAPGFVPASAHVALGNASEVRIDFRLRPAPRHDPHEETAGYGGHIGCYVAVSGGDDHGGGGPPPSANCGATDLNDRRTIAVPIRSGAGGLLLELVWRELTPLGRQLTVEVTVAGGEPGHASGPSVLRVALGPSALAAIPEGGVVEVEVSVAGMAEGEEEGAASAGLAFQQPFTLYATAFYGQPVLDGFTAVPE